MKSDDINFSSKKKPQNDQARAHDARKLNNKCHGSGI
jgi:hypothetical protein